MQSSIVIEGFKTSSFSKEKFLKGKRQNLTFNKLKQSAKADFVVTLLNCA